MERKHEVGRSENSNIIKVSCNPNDTNQINRFFEVGIRYLYTMDEIELHSVGDAIYVAVAVGDKLVRDQLASWKSFRTSTVEFDLDQVKRTIKKPRTIAILRRHQNFQNNLMRKNLNMSQNQ